MNYVQLYQKPYFFTSWLVGGLDCTFPGLFRSHANVTLKGVISFGWYADSEELLP